MGKRGDEVRERLIKLRQQRGWSQEDLAVAMGYELPAGQVKVSRWESGAVRLRMEDAERIAAAMKVPVFLLLPETGLSWVVEWFEAAVRHHDGLPEDQERLREALQLVSRILGPPPEEHDQAGWALYLQEVRIMLSRTQQQMTGGIGPRSANSKPPEVP